MIRIKVKYFLIAVTVCIQLILLCPVSALADSDAMQTPTVEAKSAVLMDMETGKVLWEKNSGEELAMASTTKIMTALIALERGNINDVVTVSKLAAGTPPVKMNLIAGEKIRLQDLLYALMMQSSNDAAVAIAEHISGTVDGFCNMMTERAKELGAVNTVFRTPNGLDKNDHHSTAYDMALIAREALRNSEFVRIINTKAVVTDGSGEFRVHEISNKNRLLSEYSGALGVKTGYTGKAGHCFVGAASKNGMTLISVVLASGWGAKGKQQKWVDTRQVLDYGFNNFEHVLLAKEATVMRSVQVTNSREKAVNLLLDETVMAPLSSAEKEKVKINLIAPDIIDSPVKQGDVVGKAAIYIDEKLYKEINLVAEGSIARHDFNTSLLKILLHWSGSAPSFN